MKTRQARTPSTKGQAYEVLACDYLRQQGLELVDKNFHSRHGEIDLIMRQQTTLVFIEVRYRKDRSFGGAVASITAAKQKRLELTALAYLQKLGREVDARFDLLAIHGTPSNLDIEWIQNVFQ